MGNSRREQVGEILLSKPFTSLEELEQRFPDVSSMTLRRDIEYYEERGDVIKVRKGARAMHFVTLTLEDSYYQRSIENVEGKNAVAKAAARFIEPGRSFYFDSGTTMMQIIPYLPDTKLNITTSDPNIALMLVKNEKYMVSLVGGLLNKGNLSVSGAAAQSYIQQTNIDVAFISPSGFSLECGLMSGNYNESLVKHEVISKARTVIMLLHSGKLNRTMPHTFATLPNVDVMITDKDPGEEIREGCLKAGTRLIVTE